MEKYRDKKSDVQVDDLMFFRQFVLSLECQDKATNDSLLEKSLEIWYNFQVEF